MVMLVIVGAGASFDCIPDVERYTDALELSPSLSRVQASVWELRPPLAKGLFDGKPAFGQFAADYGQVRPLIWTLRQARDPDALEDQLEAYERAAEEHPQKLFHLMAMRFYLRDVIRLCTEAMLSIQADAGLTNYVGLVAELHAWATRSAEHVCVVNFNYDFLLEQACEDVWMFDRSSPDNYISDPVFSIVKPHGAVDWERPMQSESRISVGRDSHSTRLHRARFAIERATSQLELGPVQISSTSSGARLPTVPALAPPIRDKSSFEWPDSQREHFEGLGGKVNRLLVVGWRAADRHFTTLAKNTFEGLSLPTIIVTGGSHADDEALSVANNLGLGGACQDTITYVNSGFTDLMTSGMLGDWLS